MPKVYLSMVICRLGIAQSEVLTRKLRWARSTFSNHQSGSMKLWFWDADS